MELVISISKEDYEKIKSLQQNTTDYQTTIKMYQAIKNGILVENTITKEEAIQWIPTSERQPEHTGDYLVTMGINYDGAGMFDCIRVASYNTCFGWGLYEKNDIHSLFGEITAWAELPKIYS